jgi:hypothetical protein
MDFKASDVAATAAFGPQIGQPSSTFSARLSTVRKEDMISKRRSFDTTFHETELARALSARLVTRTDGSGGGIDAVDAGVPGRSDGRLEDVVGWSTVDGFFFLKRRMFLTRSRLRVGWDMAAAVSRVQVVDSRFSA